MESIRQIRKKISQRGLYTVFPHIVAAATILFWIHLVRKLFKFSFPLCSENLNSFLTRWGNYSRRGNYSREETIWGNTVTTIFSILPKNGQKIRPNYHDTSGRIVLVHFMEELKTPNNLTFTFVHYVQFSSKDPETPQTKLNQPAALDFMEHIIFHPGCLLVWLILL